MIPAIKKTMTKAEELKKAEEILQNLIEKQKAKREKLNDPDEVIKTANEYILISEQVLYLNTIIDHLQTISK